MIATRLVMTGLPLCGCIARSQAGSCCAGGRRLRYDARSLRRRLMKLLRYGPRGQEKPGLLGADAVLRDLSQVIPDLTASMLGPELLQRLAGIDAASLPRVAGTPRLGVPVKGIGKFLAIGLNYADHAKEAGLPIPTE